MLEEASSAGGCPRHRIGACPCDGKGVFVIGGGYFQKIESDVRQVVQVELDAVEAERKSGIVWCWIWRVWP